MKKVLSILMVASAIVVMVSCGNNGNKKSRNASQDSAKKEQVAKDESTTRLTGAKYYRKVTSAGDVTEHTITFGKGNEVEYHVVWNWSEGGSNYEASGDKTFRGTYTYEESGQGNNWKAEGKLTLSRGSSEFYTTEYFADGDNIKIFNAMPNGDIINIAKIIEK